MLSLEGNWSWKDEEGIWEGNCSHNRTKDGSGVTHGDGKAKGREGAKIKSAASERPVREVTSSWIEEAGARKRSPAFRY